MLAVQKGSDCLIQLKGNQKKLLMRALHWATHKPDDQITVLDKGHGRLEERLVKVFPFSADFPFVKSLIVVERCRTIIKSGQRSSESALFLSTAAHDRYSPQQWCGLIRGHWGGIEIRNHWRRDALLNEDRTRSRDPNICGTLALLRNACLAAVALIDDLPDFNSIKLLCTHKPKFALDIISGSFSPP